MVSLATAREIALSFPETDEHPHFERKSFRVRKKIFATLHEPEKRVVVKLSLLDQSVFCAFDQKVIYPLPGGWGRKGWTMIGLARIRKSLFKDALTVAYCTVAPRKLAEKFKI
jgi:predicted DNA-binding protein (MmcQ/YjbR family)